MACSHMEKDRTQVLLVGSVTMVMVLVGGDGVSRRCGQGWSAAATSGHGRQLGCKLLQSGSKMNDQTLFGSSESLALVEVQYPPL
jgi:hypothetical protein